MESKTTRKRKNHKEEFKREAVRLLEGRGERTVADVAASLGVAENLLHAWGSRICVIDAVLQEASTRKS